MIKGTSDRKVWVSRRKSMASCIDFPLNGSTVELLHRYVLACVQEAKLMKTTEILIRQTHHSRKAPEL